MDGASATDGTVAGTVLATSFLGPITRLTVDVGDAGVVVAQLPTDAALTFSTGTRVRVRLRPDPVLVSPTAG